MSNVLSEEKKQQVIALGKLGWPLRRIEQATGVRRETASAYLKSAGVVVCLPGWGRRAPAKPAIGVTTDPDPSKPANEVTTDLGQPISPPTAKQDRATSACEPYRELIEQGLQSWPECHGHLAGLGFRSRLSPRLPNREAFCSQAAWIGGGHKPWGSSSPPPEKRPRSITAAVRWSVTRRVASTGGRDCSC